MFFLVGRFIIGFEKFGGDSLFIFLDGYFVRVVEFVVSRAFCRFVVFLIVDFEFVSVLFGCIVEKFVYENYVMFEGMRILFFVL